MYNDNPTALEYVKCKTLKLCERAVNLELSNPKNKELLSFTFVDPEFQTETMCENAVHRNGLLLKYVAEKIKTSKICTIAVNQNKLASKFLGKTTISIDIEKK